jgi:hypothetical protein
MSVISAMSGYHKHVLWPHSKFQEGGPTGHLVKCRSTSCDSIYACEGSFTGENLSPVGEGVWSMCSVKETVIRWCIQKFPD